MASRRIVIANTTPLINFAEIGSIRLLRDLFGEVVVPEAVVAELLFKADLFPTAAAVPDEPFIRVRQVVNRPLVANLVRELHPGEAECLALGLDETSALLLLDDLAARSIAEYHGLRFTGTLGCLRLAKERGLLPALAPVLNELRVKARFWLTTELMQRVLRDAGE